MLAGKKSALVDFGHLSILQTGNILVEPNDESGANVDAAILWRENREEFNKIARRLVRKTLGLPS